MADLCNQICEATSIIVNKAIQNLSYDITVKATIIKENEVDGKISGEYLCQYESNRFVAYGSPCSHSAEDTVYVTVPNGDWDNKKFIIENKNSITILYEDEKFKAYDKDGNFVGIIGGETPSPQYENFESKKW